MKQPLILTIPVLALLNSGATLAVSGTTDNEATHVANTAMTLEQMPEPDTYADDICWVAPEWRNE